MKNLERSLTVFLFILIGMVIVQSARIQHLSEREIAAALSPANNRSPAVLK